MINEDLAIITITGEFARGSSRPTIVKFRVTEKASSTKETLGQAITEACRMLNTELREAAR